MLLTRLSSLQLDFDNTVDNAQLVKALSVTLDDKQIMPDSSVVLPYQVRPKTALELNQALWGLIDSTIGSIPESGITSALGYPDAFENFDDKTWILLHLACARCDVASNQNFQQRIYSWVLLSSSALANDNRMQARLFLLSQPGFDVNRDEHGVIIGPILASTDPWNYLALLTCRNLNLTKEQEVLFRTRITEALQTITSYGKNSKEKQASLLWVFMRASGINSSAQKEALLINMITQINLTTETIPTLPAAALAALVTISNGIEPQIHLEFRAALVTHYILNVQLEYPEKRVQEEYFVVVDKFLGSVGAPGILDTMQNKEALNAKLNQVCNLSLSNPNSGQNECNVANRFLTNIFQVLWGTHYETSRSISNHSLDWLMNLDVFKHYFSFSASPTTQRRFVSNLVGIFTAKDDYFIEKFFVLNAELTDRPLFRAMTQFPNYDHVNIQSGVTRLLQDPDFNITEYYEKSNELFKALPQVNTAMQLQRLFTFNTSTSPEKRRPSMLGTRTTWEEQLIVIKEAAEANFDPEIFKSELTQRYAEKLQILVRDAAKEEADKAKEVVAYKKIKRIFELVKIVRKRSPDVYKQLNIHPNFLEFVFTYRINRYINAMDTLKDRAVQAVKGVLNTLRHATSTHPVDTELRHKDAKVFFFQYIKLNLKTLLDNSATQTNITRPFLWDVYIYVQGMTGKKLTLEDKKWSPEKTEDLNKWLIDVILHGKKTAETLAHLPPELIEEIFASVDLNENGTHFSNTQIIWKKGLGESVDTQEKAEAALEVLEGDAAESVDSNSKKAASSTSSQNESVSSSSGVDLSQSYTKNNESAKGKLLSTLGFR